jgi:hypothetical protein
MEEDRDSQADQIELVEINNIQDDLPEAIQEDD